MKQARDKSSMACTAGPLNKGDPRQDGGGVEQWLQ